MFPHVCGMCYMGFVTAAKLCNHVTSRSRCKPAAPEVPGADGDVIVAQLDQPEVPAGGGDDIVAQLDQLAEQIKAAVPGGFGDNAGQLMDLGQHQGAITFHGSENLEQMLAAGGPPIAVIVNPDEADGRLHLQPVL